MGISNKDGCLFKRFEFIFPNFAVQEFSAKLRVDSEEFTSNTTKEGQEMCKIKDQQTHLKKKKKLANVSASQAAYGGRATPAGLRCRSTVYLSGKQGPSFNSKSISLLLWETGKLSS